MRLNWVTVHRVTTEPPADAPPGTPGVDALQVRAHYSTADLEGDPVHKELNYTRADTTAAAAAFLELMETITGDLQAKRAADRAADRAHTGGAGSAPSGPGPVLVSSSAPSPE